jgi:hypothetical protein
MSTNPVVLGLHLATDPVSTQITIFQTSLTFVPQLTSRMSVQSLEHRRTKLFATKTPSNQYHLQPSHCLHQHRWHQYQSQPVTEMRSHRPSQHKLQRLPCLMKIRILFVNPFHNVGNAHMGQRVAIDMS